MYASMPNLLAKHLFSSFNFVAKKFFKKIQFQAIKPRKPRGLGLNKVSGNFARMQLAVTWVTPPPPHPVFKERNHKIFQTVYYTYTKAKQKRAIKRVKKEIIVTRVTAQPPQQHGRNFERKKLSFSPASTQRKLERFPLKKSAHPPPPHSPVQDGAQVPPKLLGGVENGGGHVTLNVVFLWRGKKTFWGAQFLGAEKTVNWHSFSKSMQQ
jgi:hypothetical protein